MTLQVHHDPRCNVLLVHDFTNPLARWQRPEHQVLSEGLRLATSATAFSACQQPKWPTANLNTPKEVQPHETTFVYNRMPPVISVDRITATYKEWGSQISDDEVFTLGDLIEFDTKAAKQGHESTGQQNRGTELNSANQATTKRRLDAALYQMVPQPHIYPSLFTDSLPQLKGQPFNRKKPIFLAPHSEFPVYEHARVAWLIPIRGVFPWHQCSSGVLLDSRMPLLVEGNLIQWNCVSLLKFWSFLLELRKAGSLGSLGISLHSARQPVENNYLQPVEGCSATISSNPHRSPISSSLATVDYIKIYHDASTSFHVRRAVDSWSYQLGASQGKVRVLKGATLPLVDEVSIGIILL